MVSASLAFALEAALFDVRNNIFKEAQTIKPLMATSKDMILLSSMWDSCIMTITQLDAYFSLVGIFNEISEKNVTEKIVQYLVDWLVTVKATNELNIKGLEAITQTIEPKTKVHVEILKAHFTSLNKRLDSEMEKVAALKITSKKPASKK